MATKKATQADKGPPPSTRPAAFAPDPADPKKTIKVGPQEVDTKGYSGSYHKNDEHPKAEPYALKVYDEGEAAEHYGHTHHLINQEHYWSGTEKQFKEQFDKN